MSIIIPISLRCIIGWQHESGKNWEMNSTLIECNRDESGRSQKLNFKVEKKKTKWTVIYSIVVGWGTGKKNRRDRKPGCNYKARKASEADRPRGDERSQDRLLWDESNRESAKRAEWEKQFEALIRLLLNVHELDLGPEVIWATYSASDTGAQICFGRPTHAGIWVFLSFLTVCRSVNFVLITTMKLQVSDFFFSIIC